jgi:hypothetical protein
VTDYAMHRSGPQRAKVQPCLSWVVELLLATSYASNLASLPLAMTMSAEMKKTVVLAQKQSIFVGGDPLLDHVQLAKVDAFNELQVAMEMYHTELALANFSTIVTQSG